MFATRSIGREQNSAYRATPAFSFFAARWRAGIINQTTGRLNIRLLVWDGPGPLPIDAMARFTALRYGNFDYVTDPLNVSRKQGLP